MLAIVIVVAGAVAIPFLPIAQFPEITPPQVVVTATYPGASAEVVEQTVDHARSSSRSTAWRT